MYLSAYADYLMVITPPESIIKEVGRYKRASVNVIGHFEGMYSCAQIIVTRQVRCKPFFGEPAIERMAGGLQTMPPIELKINGFGFFDESQTAKTIYALIERTDKTDKWFRLLMKQMGIKVKGFVPHIVIAKNIPLTSFNKLWANFDNRVFSETFTVNSLTVLHRETFVEYCEWRVYKELLFASRLTVAF